MDINAEIETRINLKSKGVEYDDDKNIITLRFDHRVYNVVLNSLKSGAPVIIAMQKEAKE